MFNQAKFRGGYNLKFISAMLFAVTFLVGGFFVVAPSAFAEITATVATPSDFITSPIDAITLGSALANGPETEGTGATQSAVSNGVITVTGAIRPKNSNVGTFTGSENGPAIAQYILFPSTATNMEEFKTVDGTKTSLGTAAINIDPTNTDRGWFDYTKQVFRMGVYLYSGNALRTDDLTIEFVFKDDNHVVVKDVFYTLRFKTTAAIGSTVTSQFLKTAGDFVILAETGIANTPTSVITGDMGVTPAAASTINGFALSVDAMNDFSTSAQVTGKIYAPGYTGGGISSNGLTPAKMTLAQTDLVNAYNAVATITPGVGASNFNLGGGTVATQTLTPGVYTWTSNVTITGDITLAGTATDVWIFQISGTLGIDAGKKIILAGALPQNVFWQVTDTVTLKPNSYFEGNILAQTNIAMQTGAVLHGRALAQTQVTLDNNTITVPGVLVDTTAPVSNPTVTIYSANLDTEWMGYPANTVFQANVNFDGGLTLSNFKGVEISLYNGTTLLATNTAKPALFSSYPNAVGATDLFGIGDVADLLADPNWNIGAYPSNLTPTSVEFKLTRTDGTVYTVTGSIDAESTAVLDAAAEEAAAALVAAKVAAHGVLTTALATYTEGNYSPANWTILNGFKTAGDTAIDAATTLEGVSSAQNTATTGMSGVDVVSSHGSSGSRPATPAVPAKKTTPPADCSAGQLFSTITGRNCNAATPAVPAVLGASTGPIPGCGNRTTGFSVATGESCVGNSTGHVLGAEKFNFTKFLKFKAGSYKVSLQGTEVMELQKLLTSLGYDLGIADGKFGPMTEGAVIKFQIAKGLKGDGVVGPLTREALNK